LNYTANISSDLNDFIRSESLNPEIIKIVTF